MPPSDPPAATRRRGYIDWLRGVAVLIMIEAHTIDAWTRADDRATAGFGWAILVGGFGAPLFLFLAGVAVALAAGARERKLGDRRRAAAAVARRGWEIFALAFLFRLQSYLLSGGGSPVALLKVDVLNIMGPSIVASAWLWGLTAAPRIRTMLFAAATAATAMVTPIVRATGLLDPLPDPVEWYLRPSPGHTNFVMFPWAGFVFAGALLGTLIQRVREPLAERRLHVWMAAAGVAVALAGYGAAFLPSLYAQSSFWTSSPTFFFLRTGLLVFALAVAWLWEQRPTGARWSPLQHFGRTSLFVYWVHVEMAYGWFSAPLHRQLPFGQALVAFALFTVFLFGLSLAWARVRGRLRRDRVPLLRSG